MQAHDIVVVDPSLWQTLARRLTVLALPLYGFATMLFPSIAHTEHSAQWFGFLVTSQFVLSSVLLSRTHLLRRRKPAIGAALFAIAVLGFACSLLMAPSDPAPFFPGKPIAALSQLCFACFGAAFLARAYPTLPIRSQRTLLWACATIGYFIFLCSVHIWIDRSQPATIASLMPGALLTICALVALTNRVVIPLAPSAAFDGAALTVTRRMMPAVAIFIPALYLIRSSAFINSSAYRLAAVSLVAAASVMGLLFWAARALQLAITARVRAEASDHRAQERLALALLSAGGGAWELNLRSEDAWWSPEMYRLWGAEPDDSIRMQASLARIDERDRDTVEHALRQAIVGHLPYRCEFRLRCGQKERWMLSSGRVHYDLDGIAEKLTGITLEITDRKAVESSLRKSNAALERSNRELQQFAHLASHDLQTPLRSIASFAELLQARHGDELCTEARQWLTRIGEAAVQLHLIVRDLLQWSRLSTQALPFTSVDLQSVTTRCLALLGEQIGSSGAQITYSSLPTVLGDRAQLTQLIFNLLENSLKFRGSVPPHICIECRELSAGHEFAVRDNGIGIEARHSQRIFEMFERLDSTQGYSGTGAGLAICQRVVERHGGRIWVDSVPGSGSTFYFTLCASTAGID